jgi:transcriptional regulator with GAF, ATPase, and Fis domain/multidrug efflux pump subunit AcrA (membrane-fusion protein)
MPLKSAAKKPRAAAARTNLNVKVAELERTIKRLMLARDITQKFVDSTSELDDLIDVIFSSVLDVLNAEAGSLWMVDWGTKKNVCHLAEGPAKEQVIDLKLDPGVGIVGKVIQKGDAEIVLDTATEVGFDDEIDANTGFKTRSMICVPLKVGRHVYGAIQIINKRSGVQGCFTAQDRMLVDDLARSASLAIKNARLIESESRVREMKVLMEISRTVVASLDLDQVLATVVNTVNELTDVQNGAVGLVHELDDEVHLATLSGESKIESDDPRQEALVDLMREVHKAGRVVYIPDAESLQKDAKEENSRWVSYLTKWELKSVWAAPLKDEESALGVLWYESTHAQMATGNKSDMLNILCSQTTLALRNASVFKSVPLSSVMGKVGSPTQRFMASPWKWLAAGTLTLVVMTALHVLPVFRSVSGECVVEARLGQGVFLPVSGRIEEVLPEEGQRVEKGEVLARLDGSQLRLALLAADSKLAILSRQIVEAQALNDSTLLRRVVLERIAATAEMEKAAEDLERIEIRASHSGVVLTPRPKELVGRMFNQGAELLRIANPKHFTIVVQIPEAHVMLVKEDQLVKGMLRAAPGEGFRGKVRHVGAAYQVPAEALEQEQITATALESGFIAEVEVLESDIVLRPGMTGHARISTPDHSSMTLLWRRIRNSLVSWFGV